MSQDKHFPLQDPSLPEEHKPTDMPAARIMILVLAGLMVVSLIVWAVTLAAGDGEPDHGQEPVRLESVN